ncbi:hypothetical protein [Leptolyngbya sp. O-77]|uniref:hypothetical protein n=1 Tax=Leptolyngbya sp. O-77 TaxID=1080068 RepID=UPI00074D290D|nr:hypothetical protein [Leptolyngbya sp. O-77]BAU40469.1 hypothetical protein O77CONTIG1_00271 [Leptolyngbya sp. O-77]
MMWIDLAHHALTWVSSAPSFADPASWSLAPDGLLWHWQLDYPTLAQQFDTDVFAGVRRAADNFVKTGQVWALLIGIIIGYLLRGFTTYG